MLLRSALMTTLLFTGFSLSAESPNIKTGKQLQQAAEAVTEDINTEALQSLIDSEPDLVLVDIRTPGEIARMGGAIKAPQNVNIVRGWLEFEITDVATSSDTPIVVYCGGNIRSPLAALTLQQMGYRNVKNYADGYLAWREAGLPVAEPER